MITRSIPVINKLHQTGLVVVVFMQYKNLSIAKQLTQGEGTKVFHSDKLRLKLEVCIQTQFR